MNDLLQTAKQFQDFCDRQGWRSCITGGIAVNRWGRRRVTLDVDLNVLTGFGGEEPVIDTLLAHYSSRIPDAKTFAISRRVLVLNSPERMAIDVSLGALPFEERASPFAFDGVELCTCSAEDLLVMKLFAFRPLDIRDAEGVAIRNRCRLDWNCIEEQLRPLAELKEQPEILLELARLREL